MPSVALAILLGLRLAFFLFLLILLYIIVKKRKRLIISLPLAVLFLGLITWAALIYRSHKSAENREAQKFLGDYKLANLDGQDCLHCLVRLTADYRYDIFKDGKIVGQGKWWLESAIDIPGLFLQLEDGPSGAMWAHERTISGIDRRNH